MFPSKSGFPSKYKIIQEGYLREKQTISGSILIKDTTRIGQKHYEELLKRSGLDKHFSITTREVERVPYAYKFEPVYNDHDDIAQINVNGEQHSPSYRVSRDYAQDALDDALLWEFARIRAIVLEEADEIDRFHSKFKIARWTPTRSLADMTDMVYAVLVRKIHEVFQSDDEVVSINGDTQSAPMVSVARAVRDYRNIVVVMSGGGVLVLKASKSYINAPHVGNVTDSKTIVKYLL